MSPEVVGSQQIEWVDITWKAIPIVISLISLIQSLVLAPRKAKARSAEERLLDSILSRIKIIELDLNSYWSASLKKPNRSKKESDRALALSIQESLKTLNTEFVSLYTIKPAIKSECERQMSDLLEYATEGEFGRETRDPDHERIRKCYKCTRKLIAELLPGAK